MNGRRFLLIFLSVVALASAASYAIVLLTGVQTRPPDKSDYGAAFHGAPIVVAGSSLEYYGLDWNLVASNYSRPIEYYTAPAASPCELEALMHRAPSPAFTIIGVALSDLDEDVISDFRADFVSPWQSWRDLVDSGANSSICERTWRQYPLRYTRMVFPTVGRSMAIMVGMRKMYRALMHSHGGAEDKQPTFNAAGDWPTERISGWTPGRALRNLEVLRAGSGGKHSFAGPKHVAFIRLLQQTAARGPVIVVVMPESPMFKSELVNDADIKEFEDSLADVAHRVPSAKWIRMDRKPELHSNDLYWDVVHLNVYGRPLATAALLKELKSILGGS